MRIVIRFQFTNEPEPSAITVAQGEITDLMLPATGDSISHTDFKGTRIRGSVVGRHFDYSLEQGASGEEIDGTITVTLSLGPMNLN